MQILMIMCCLFLLSGCGAFATTDIQGTVDAGNYQYSTEAAALAGTANINQTEVMATVSRAETTVAEVNSVNQQLFATLAAVSTPTPALIAGQVSVDEIMASGDEMALGQSDSGVFTRTGISDTVNTETGCVMNPRSSFSRSSINQLYATVEGFNVGGGTPMAVVFYREGEVVFQDQWSVPNNVGHICVFFRITRDATDFPAGNWSVEVFANGALIEERTTFQITN